jgi:hypothetical protein
MRENPDSIRVESFIWKRGAFGKEDQPLYTGLSNHCYEKGLFHLYLDVDDYANLRQILDRLDHLRKRFRELANAKVLILQTSPWHFHLASFIRLTWKRYVDILYYADSIGLEDYGHALFSIDKGYAGLRTGAKDGIVPRILYSVGDAVACKKCFGEFVECISSNAT